MHKYIIVSLISNVILYLIIAFILLDIYWADKIPQYSEYDRFCLVFLYFAKELGIIFWIKDENKNKTA